MRISVFASKELQAIVPLLKSFDVNLRREIRRSTKTVAQPAWQEEVRGNVNTRLETRVLADTARVSVSDQNVMLQSANVGRALSGGAKPSEIYHSAEFGADQNFVRNGRHTRRQFKPRNLKGYVVYPAAARLIPRLASLWVQTTIRTAYESFEGKGSNG